MKANGIDFQDIYIKSKKDIKQLLKEKVLILDGATGTLLQETEIPKNSWNTKINGCNEILNKTSPEIIKNIHTKYIESGANIIKTNTFGTSYWTLANYGLEKDSYELSYLGAKLAKEACIESSNSELFIAGTIGPGSKIASFGDISYDELYSGYKIVASGLVDGGVDLFLIETSQDPLQIKACLHACQDTANLPIMISVTIEENNAMLVGTDVETIAKTLDGFDILSIGFNCGTGPKELKEHVDKLSSIINIPVSIHANAGLPKNIGGKTVYSMDGEEFACLQSDFLENKNVAILGGCCGTTPEHIKKLREKTSSSAGVILDEDKKTNNFVTSLYKNVEFKKGEVVLIGERCNAIGSKKFKKLIEDGDIEGIIELAKKQIIDGADVIDLNVGIPGLDEKSNIIKVIKEFKTKILAPIAIDSNNTEVIEESLKYIGAKPIINSVNLEDGEEALGDICKLAKKHNTSLVCLAIDEKGMAKTKERKLEIASRIYDLAVNKYGLKPKDLIFDLLAFTVGTGQESNKNVGKETLEAIEELTKTFPEVNTTLGLSNISHGLNGLNPDARKVLNSVFLELAKNAGLTSAIVDAKNIIKIDDISEIDIEVCESLLLNKKTNALFNFIEHFSDFKLGEEKEDDFENLDDKEKIKTLVKDANTKQLIDLIEKVRYNISPEKIINEILLETMKEIGVGFGNGTIQMPFVLASAETMNKAVKYLDQYLEKDNKQSKSRIVLGTVKGDVHDVGKNLTNIILTNNGYDVVDLGTKVGIHSFIELYEKYKGTENEIKAIGFSGLLVKSTNVMLENLRYLEVRRIKIPVLLGGAALNRKFVDNYCKRIYSGPVYYCKDAFDGIEALEEVMKNTLDNLQ